MRVSLHDHNKNFSARLFYFYERAKVGALKPRVVLIMAELAALFALFSPYSIPVARRTSEEATGDLGKFH